MSRPLRIEYPGAWYHVMNRGRRREDIFGSKYDYERFIITLQETAMLHGLKVSAYCLMKNHYHLLVQTPEGNLGRCMRHINGVYAQRYNRYHKTDGSLFRGRYKAVLIDGDSHLLEVLRYIHNNPVKAGVVECCGDFLWSSHRGYLSKSEEWAWLHKDFLLGMLADRSKSDEQSYAHFMGQPESEIIEKFYSLQNLPAILGGDKFKDWIKSRFSHLRDTPQVTVSQNLVSDPEQVISMVCECLHVDRDSMFKVMRGIENAPRDLAMFLVRQQSRLTLLSTGKLFGMRNYSTVSTAIERAKKRLEHDKSLQQQVASIVRKLR